MPTDKPKPLPFEVVVHYAGSYQIIDTNEGELVSIAKILTEAMHNGWSGKPPYFCNFNLLPVTDAEVKQVWVNTIRSDRIDGYYIRSKATSYSDLSERHMKAVEKLAAIAEKESRDEDWKQGGDDAD